MPTTTKKAKAPKTAKRARTSAADLQAQVNKVLADGKPHTSRDVVLALGRKCGSAQGWPVVKQLHAMHDAGEVVVTDGAYSGYIWQRSGGKRKAARKATK